MSNTRFVPLMLALALTALPAPAQTFRDRCRLALTTARSKGVRMALRSWPHLAGPSLDLDGDALHRNPSLVSTFAGRVARHLGRALDAAEYESAALEIVLDRGSSPAALADALRLARLIDLDRPAALLKALRGHPALSEPSEVLLLALNKTIPAKVISGLIMQAIHDEARRDGDLPSWDTPYSARPAPRIVQLNREGRINDGALIVAFSALFEARRANLGGLFTNLAFLEAWVRDLYVADKPLPARDLTRALTGTIRGRLTQADGNVNLKNAAFATLTRIEILLGL